MNEYERGLLVAFLRLNLTDAQQEIMCKFYPELADLCGIKLTTHGVPAVLFQSLRDLCLKDKRISAIKELRQWARDTYGVQGVNQVPNNQLGLLKTAKDFIDEHFPREAG